MDLTTLLVATDLSQRSFVAVRRALGIAQANGSRLILLHVVDEDLPGPVAREIRRAATEAVQKMVPEIGASEGLNWQVQIRTGNPWKSVLAAAKEYGAGLVVLGSHRGRGMAELFSGTVLERIAKRAKVPVLMVNGPADTAYRQVLVGVDFSPSAQVAAAAAVQLAPKAKVTLATTYHVAFREFIDRAVPGDSDVQAEKKHIEQGLEARMTTFRDACPARPEGYRFAYMESGPAEGLVQLARTKEADLICVGSHGRNWAAEIVLGSTATELLYSAPCDVLVARS